jgi:hypothetical protein
LHQIGAKATAALGPADAAPFLTRCCSQNLQALAATSVEDAAKLHAVARSTLQLLLELPTAEQTTKLKQLDELITALLTQLRAAAEALQAAPQGDPQLSLPKVVDLLKALVQLRKLGGRLVAARAFLGAVFAASAARAAAGSAPAANCRAEMVRLVRVSLSAAGRPSSDLGRRRLHLGVKRFGHPADRRVARQGARLQPVAVRSTELTQRGERLECGRGHVEGYLCSGAGAPW